VALPSRQYFRLREVAESSARLAVMVLLVRWSAHGLPRAQGRFIT